MFLWFISILALVISIFGLYAFIRLVSSTNDEKTSIHLLNMAEFSKLNPDLRRLYEKTFVEIMAPSAMKALNEAYEALRKKMTYDEIERNLIAQANTNAAILETYSNYLKENMTFENPVEGFTSTINVLMGKQPY